MLRKLEIVSDFPTRLRELRKAKGYTQQELADILGLSKQTIYEYEKGRRYPKGKEITPTLVKIANCFSVSIEYLLGAQKEQKK